MCPPGAGPGSLSGLPSEPSSRHPWETSAGSETLSGEQLRGTGDFPSHTT